jgi:solute carrier family 35 (UDP-galactose transporter), member B1
LFNISGNRKETADNNSWVGMLLLSLSLIFDGFTGVIEEGMLDVKKINEKEAKKAKNSPSKSKSPSLSYIPMRSPNSFELMLGVNGWAALAALIVVVVTGKFSSLWSFFHNSNVMWFCLSGVCGQLCLFATLSWFGPAVCSLATLIRKLLTMVLSLVVFGHGLNFNQALGVSITSFFLLILLFFCLVFYTLIYAYIT